MPPRVFISHSANDRETAAALIRFLEASLGLGPTDIRCTSVPGYGLPGGELTSDALREELLGAGVLIGIVSSPGMASAYVLFELGARWGAKKPLIPLLRPGTGAAILKGPLKEINALRCEEPRELLLLLDQVAGLLHERVRPQLDYEDALLALSKVGLDPRLELDQEKVLSHVSKAEGMLFSVHALMQVLETSFAPSERVLRSLVDLELVEIVPKGWGRAYRVTGLGLDLAAKRGLLG